MSSKYQLVKKKNFRTSNTICEDSIHMGKLHPYLTSTQNLWITGQCMLGRFKKRVSSKRYSAKYLSMSFGGYLSHSTRQPVYDPKKFQVSEALCSSWWLRSSSVPHWSHVYYGSLEVLWFQTMDTKSAVGDEPFQWLTDIFLEGST